MNIQEIIELSDLAKSKGNFFPLKRDLYATVSCLEGRHFAGIVGPRGVGKTVLLQQLAASMPDALYLSADTLAYLKSTRGAKIPDFMVTIGDMRAAVEIGGKGKGREQFKGVRADHKIVFAHQDAPDGRKLPLFLLGLVQQ